MAGDLKTKSCLIADHGTFVELAPRLARDFGEVKLFVPWMSKCPKSAPFYIGTGLPHVEHVDTFCDHVADADVVVFPDLYFADWQETVRERFNKPVWGHRLAENLEIDRLGARKMQKESDIKSPGTKYILGVDSLAELLKTVEDKWVKLSCYTGDGGTWHHDTWQTSEVYLNHLRQQAGPLAEKYEFLVEDNVEGIEVEYNGFCVGGEWPEASYYGIEDKRGAYIGKFSPYDELPEHMRNINSNMALILKGEKGVGFCSFESRLPKSGKALVTHSRMRPSFLSFAGIIEGYSNLADIVWQGAHESIAPVWSVGKFIAVAAIHCEFAQSNWVPLEIPDSIERWVKVRNKAVINGKVYHVPIQDECPEIGAVVGIANSLKKAKQIVIDRAEKVKGYNVEVRVDALDRVEESIEEAKEYGVKF